MNDIDKNSILIVLRQIIDQLETMSEAKYAQVARRLPAFKAMLDSVDKAPSEPGPLPDHHKQWFNQLQLAAMNGHLALMSCLDVATSESRSVICLVGWDGSEYLFTPVGHLCTEDNPFEAYGPPSAEGRIIPDLKNPSSTG